MSPKVRMRGKATIADLLAIPEEERFHELIDGEIVQKASPSGAHGSAQIEVGTLINGAFGHRPGGRGPGGWWFASEVDVQLGADVCRPDVVGWRRDRVSERPREAIVKVLPDWICEVLSARNKRNDLIRKKHVYHRNRIGHYWIVDPEEEMLSVNRWTEDGYLEVIAAERGDRIRAEPFDAIEFNVGVLFGDDPEE